MRRFGVIIVCLRSFRNRSIKLVVCNADDADTLSGNPPSGLSSAPTCGRPRWVSLLAESFDLRLHLVRDSLESQYLRASLC